MKPKLLLTVAAIYMGLLGILLLVFPIMAFGLAPDAPASLIAKLRLPGSLFLAFAVMNWFARNSDASSARCHLYRQHGGVCIRDYSGFPYNHNPWRKSIKLDIYCD